MSLTKPSILLILISVCICVSVHAGSDPRRMIAILENERALEAEPDIKLVEFVQAREPSIRARSVLAIARIGNPAALPALLPLLQDPSDEVRTNVAFALGQIKDKRGLKATLQLVADASINVRVRAIEALGRIGGLEISSELVKLLRDPETTVREQAALSLALIKDKGTVGVLNELAARKDPAQWSYVYALYRLADERSVAVLHAVIAQPQHSVSTDDPSSLLFALKALWSMKKPVTVEELRTLLKHNDARVQQNALDVAAAAPNARFCSVLTEAFDRLTLHSRWKLVDAAGDVPCVGIARRATGDPNLTIRGAGINALAKIEKDKVIDQLNILVSHPSWVIRWRTAQALSHLSPGTAISLLKQLANDSDKAVKLAALDSLSAFMPRTAELFVPLLRNDDFAVRATAADALGKTKDRKYLQPLLDLYRASQEESEVEGRIAILAVLADYNTSEALQLYSEALADPSYTVRRHSVDALKKIVGSRFYYRGQVRDPDDFLFRDTRIPVQIQNKYPESYGLVEDDAVVQMRLQKGIVVIRLLGRHAPLHVNNFLDLARRGFYEQLRIHRVVPNFVIQGGDPRGDGWGSAGAVLMDQFNALPFNRAVVGMPTAGKDTGGSQFFITHSRQPHLDGNYTVFGIVESGMEFVDSTEIGDRILKVSINPSPNSN